MKEDFSTVICCFVEGCTQCPEPFRYPGRTYVDTRKRKPKWSGRTQISLSDPHEQGASEGSNVDYEAGSHPESTDASQGDSDVSVRILDSDDDPRNALGIPGKPGRPRKWRSEAERLRSFRRKVRCEGSTNPAQ